MIRTYLAIAHADFLERSRSTRFWVALAVMGIVTWWCFPPLDAGYITVGFGDGDRARYSSAWVGMVLGLVYSTLLSLIGFYIVRGTVARDFDTRVWQLLVATPMTRGGYLVAKWASHMLVFALILFIGIAVGLTAQWWRAEDSDIRVFEAVKPALLIAMPALGLTAFFAVLFDVLPWLRRTGGNILYFWVWVLGLINLGAVIDPDTGVLPALALYTDPFGMALFTQDVGGYLARVAPQVDISALNIGSSTVAVGATVFEWKQWTPSLLALTSRLAWMLPPLLFLLLLSRKLDWAASRVTGVANKSGSGAGLRLLWLDWLLAPLKRGGLGVIIAAELQMMMRAHGYAWLLVMAVLLLVQTFAEHEGMAIAAIVAWLLNLSVFSRAALREQETGTAALVFTAAGIRPRLLLARLLAAGAVAVLCVLPSLIRLGAGGPSDGLVGVLAVAMALPVAGFALAALVGNPRLFEMLVVALAYIGVQGDATLNPLADPDATLARHAIIIPLSLLILGPRWPALTRKF